MPVPTAVSSLDAARPKALEFFAGIGLARMGLEQAGFRIAWSNDYEPTKHAMYQAQFRDEERDTGHTYVVGDVFQVDPETLPKKAALAWASSPCTDLSLAGSRGGIRAGESNAFWGFVEALKRLGKDRPETVVLENVVGLATSHGGDDITSAIRALNELGYSIDVLAIDARHFVPQSRTRLFLVGSHAPPTLDSSTPSEVRPDFLTWIFEDRTLRTHRAHLPALPPIMKSGLDAFIESMPTNDGRWWSVERTQAFLNSLSPVQERRLTVIRNAPKATFRTAYRRTRKGTATWEVRPDEISGCLRTARGGSSKQAVVQAGMGSIQVRWMTPVEYARLMGAEDYNLDGARTNQALFAFGDAVAVPVVKWLGQNYLMPLTKGTWRSDARLANAQ